MYTVWSCRLSHLVHQTCPRLGCGPSGRGQIVSLLALRYAAQPKIAFRISVLTLLCYGLFVTSVGEPQGQRVFWALVFPVYAFLLFGGREGLIWIIGGFVGCLAAFLDPRDVWATFATTNSRFLLTYCILGILVIAFEKIVYQAQADIVRERTSMLEEAIRRLSTQIEERQRAETALQVSEERFRTLSEASFEGLALTDVGVFVDLNDQLARMLGYERSELVGKPVIQCVAPEHRELVQKAIRSGAKGPYEHLALRKDGSVLPVEAQAGTRTVDGRVIRTTALRDISERTRAEAEIREAKEYAEAILDSLPGTFFVLDEELRLTRWNRNFEMVSGYGPEELLGREPLELIEEADRDAIANILEESAAVSKNMSVEANALTKSGSVIPYLFTAVWRTIGGRSYLLGSGADISDLRRAEEQLRKSEELFRTVFEIAPDAVSISKLARGIFVDVNQSFSDLMGYSKDELIGKSAIDLNIWTQINIREEMIRNLAKDGVVRNVEATFCCKDGTLKQGLLSGSSIMLDGEAHLLAIVKDITVIKNAEAERMRLERQVQHAQKLESLGVLAGGIAHDFNNILTGILGNADLALMRISPLAPARGNLEEIRKAALRAAGLANQMLAYSGKGKFELRSIDLSSLVKEMAQLMEVSISKKAVLTYDLTDDLPIIQGDVNQIRQVVMNLITNASESLGRGTGVIRLCTSSAFCDRTYLDAMGAGAHTIHEEPLPEGLYVSLEVTDSGCGMDLETQSRVFDPFFTTKFSGRGLGMSAVLGIVRGHEGMVKIYSEIGKGTTFKILFPAGKDLDASQKPNLGEENLHQVLQEGLVLVADDETTVCNVAKEMLEEMGLTVLTAWDGNQAVEIFREHVDKILFVLLDLTMPGLDGAQAFREMRRLNPKVKVILSSGYNEQDVTQRFVGKGLAGFIQKPYTMVKLREKLNEVFGTS
jgi:two-component system, cell cycle sensor histidine kinase and response regulator CckA